MGTQPHGKVGGGTPAFETTKEYMEAVLPRTAAEMKCQESLGAGCGICQVKGGRCEDVWWWAQRKGTGHSKEGMDEWVLSEEEELRGLTEVKAPGKRLAERAEGGSSLLHSLGSWSEVRPGS